MSCSRMPPAVARMGSSRMQWVWTEGASSRSQFRAMGFIVPLLVRDFGRWGSAFRESGAWELEILGAWRGWNRITAKICAGASDLARGWSVRIANRMVCVCYVLHRLYRIGRTSGGR